VRTSKLKRTTYSLRLYMMRSVGFFLLASETYKDCKLSSAALRRIVLGLHVPSRTAVYEILSTPVGVTESPRKGAAVALNGYLGIFYSRLDMQDACA
jgi:hypothetical protein